MARLGTFGGFSFDPDVFTDYISERDPVNSLLITSGVVVPAPEGVTSALSDKNNVVTIPLYIPFVGDPLNYDGETNNVPATLQGKKMTAMSYGRMKAWKESDFTHELTGANDLANVARKIGDYQTKHNQKTLLHILKGIAGVSSFADHVSDIARTTAGDIQDANRLTPDAVILAMQEALGDHMEELKVWFMHSAVFTDLVRQKYATEVLVAEGVQTSNPFNRMFLGLPVIVDDSLTVELNYKSTGKTAYRTFLAGTGLVMTTPARVDTPSWVEYDAETNGGVTKLYNKWRRLLHPYGFSLAVGDIAKESPTNVEFATSNNWEQVYDGKNIPLVVFISNVA